VAEATEGTRSATMRPLALYALDHPRVPLLLVDFCMDFCIALNGIGQRSLIFTIRVYFL
jgi:hypothetical protein